MNEWPDGAGGLELGSDGGQLPEQAVPGRGAVGGPKAIRAGVRQCRSRAREAVAEAEHPDPAAVEYVVKAASSTG